MKRKIRILLTIPNFETAGSTKVLYDLAKGLDRNRFEVAIACEHDGGSFFEEVKKLGWPIYLRECTYSYRPYATLWWRVNDFAKFIKEHQFDIVHSWHWSSDWTEALATKKAGAQFVFTKKAMSWGNKHWKIRSFLADFIFTINHEMRAYFPNKRNQKLVPLGIDTDYYAPSTVNAAFQSEDFTIVSIANFVPVKGIEVLIKAVSLLENPTINLKLVGGGDSNYMDDLKSKIAAFGMESQVEFMGRQSDVRPFLKAADLYVIPTLDEGRKEGMPMALVEAMSMGTPVVGSDISGINFVLKEFPELLFEASNAVDLSKKITVLMNKTAEERKLLGGELRKYCEDHYRMELFIRESEKIYSSLCAN